MVVLSNASIEAIFRAQPEPELRRAGSVSLNEINNGPSSFIITSNVNAHNTGNSRLTDAPGYIHASDTSIIRSIGGVGTGGSAVWAEQPPVKSLLGKAYRRLQDAGAESRQVVPGQCYHPGSIRCCHRDHIRRRSLRRVCGVAGSVSINTTGNTVRHIKNSPFADDNVYIWLIPTNTIHGYGRTPAGGLQEPAGRPLSIHREIPGPIIGPA